jgi:hypothetical protein
MSANEVVGQTVVAPTSVERSAGVCERAPQGVDRARLTTELTQSPWLRNVPKRCHPPFLQSSFDVGPLGGWVVVVGGWVVVVGGWVVVVGGCVVVVGGCVVVVGGCVVVVGGGV